MAGAMLQRQANKAVDAPAHGPSAHAATAPRLGNQALLRRLQPKLRVGAVEDPLEREADAAAETVLAGGPPPALAPAPSAVSRKCAACDEDETPVQREALAPAPDAAPASVEAVLESPGRPLDPASRRFFGERFGRDFGAVRVHDDGAAARSAADVNARAYTVGSHVVFGAGEHAPATPEGARLMAHELAHVVQQDGGVVRRVAPAVVYGGAITGGAALGLAAGASWDLYQLSKIGDRPGGGAAAFSSSGCPANFCVPFADPAQAKLDWTDARPRFYRLLTAWFGERVWPLWDVYLHGGSARRDISADFARDFTDADGTARSAEALRISLANDIANNHAALLGGAQTTVVDFTPRLPALQTSLNTRGDPAQLRFPADFRSIPGSFAGGVDVQQTTNNTGSPIDPATGKPRPGQPDTRAFTMSATLTRRGAQIEVAPKIDFVVQDTIDFCPGNCGGSLIQNVTIPMSRFEASGMAGDVPFVVSFPAPADKQKTFTVQTGGAP